ncbi:hypothetical protein BGZ98_002046 [Dissophora globulifera]|nr:hypothetical protein BGZ98_002046 [Dissophora globulifera]
MLIKFPMLEVLSSRYRRKQTSLITDTHTLKDMLRNGDIVPHSLRLRHWNVFHPYMVEEDVAGFKQILDAITVVGLEASDSKDGSGHSESASKKRSRGVTLDIRLCRGHVQEPLTTTTAALPTTASHGGGGMHWAAPSGRSATGPQVGSVASTTGGATPSVTSTTTLPPQLCNNIVWVLEKCRVCNAPQDQCWKCVWQCKTCGSARAPPYINHQTALERERFRHAPATTLQIPSATAPASGVDLESVPVTGNAYSAEICRPVTPPGSISLSRMSNPSVGIRSAYIATHQSARHDLLMSSAIASGLASPSPQVVGATLSRPPEFSFFD